MTTRARSGPPFRLQYRPDIRPGNEPAESELPKPACHTGGVHTSLAAGPEYRREVAKTTASSKRRVRPARPFAASGADESAVDREPVLQRQRPAVDPPRLDAQLPVAARRAAARRPTTRAGSGRAARPGRRGAAFRWPARARRRGPAARAAASRSRAPSGCPAAGNSGTRNRPWRRAPRRARPRRARTGRCRRAARGPRSACRARR